MRSLAIIAAFAPALAGAQEPGPRREEPPPIYPSRPDAPAPTTRAKPGDASIPGLEDTDFKVRAAPLRREGTFLLRRRASLLKLHDGQKTLLFHKDESGDAERPMVLVPFPTLHRTEQVAGERAHT